VPLHEDLIQMEIEPRAQPVPQPPAALLGIAVEQDAARRHDLRTGIGL
jgi:hypothetical protein